MRYDDKPDHNRKSRLLWNLIIVVIFSTIVILGFLKILPLYLGISFLVIGFIVLVSVNFFIFREKDSENLS